MNSNIISNAKEIFDYAIAGAGAFTAINEATGGRFTFKVQAPRKFRNGPIDYDSDVRFVKVLTGPDNESSYRYIGTIFLKDKKFIVTRKVQIAPEAPSIRAFKWVWSRIASGADLGTVKVYHEGICGRCGRKLTVPESIESGYGPECINHVHRKEN